MPSTLFLSFFALDVLLPPSSSPLQHASRSSATTTTLLIQSTRRSHASSQHLAKRFATRVHFTGVSSPRVFPFLCPFFFLHVTVLCALSFSGSSDSCNNEEIPGLKCHLIRAGGSGGLRRICSNATPGLDYTHAFLHKLTSNGNVLPRATLVTKVPVVRHSTKL